MAGKAAESMTSLSKAPPDNGRPHNSLADLPKTWHFTASLPPDPMFPTPAASHSTPRADIGPRLVRGALYSFVRPERSKDPELLAVSPAALHDLGLAPGEETTKEFAETVAGNMLHGWDEERLVGGYPWAQCYGGYQFGQWAGQLGDGRAISLFEATNPSTGVRYEVQLKGAGMTPYSRFADGRAVLRSSIRELVASEALHALGIPTTRALSLTLLPHLQVARERMEPGAIVLRFAQSWLRLGTFDLLYARGDHQLLRRLATYVAEDVFGGWDKLPGRIHSQPNCSEITASSVIPHTGVGASDIEGLDSLAENRFARLFREIVRRNAYTVGKWQAYGFMNGVLNTDNTSVYGLSIDFGPFAFMDTFIPSYTPNHDDSLQRYSYQNQPAIIWWNLVRLGRALGSLMGAGAAVDEADFLAVGVPEAKEDEVEERLQKLMTQIEEEYKFVLRDSYRCSMMSRLGLRSTPQSDFDKLQSDLLEILEGLKLDFHTFFRRLGSLSLTDLYSEASRQDKAGIFFSGESTYGRDEAGARRRLASWLDTWRHRISEDWGEDLQAEQARKEAMRRVNPNFVPRSWILDEVKRRVEKEGDRAVLSRIMHMALHPFEDRWDGQSFDGAVWTGNRAEELRWTGDVPVTQRSLQCSCSS